MIRERQNKMRYKTIKNLLNIMRNKKKKKCKKR